MALVWFAIACSCAALVMGSRHLIHLFQLESYQFMGFFRSLSRAWKKEAGTAGLLALEHGLVFLLCHALGAGTLAVLLSGVLLAALGVLDWKLLSSRREKKKLVLTARVKRLMVSEAVTFFLLELLLYFLVGGLPPFPGRFLITLLFPLLLPAWFALAALVAFPVEKGIQEMYFQDARHMLMARPDLTCIGITGSYGKTSVKFILGTILQEKYQVLVTPSSFNTPMGLTKVIRSSLLPSHQVFVAEMGARHVGDIRELCRLVHPVYGVLTSVGPQHLDTFHTVDNISRTKYELMDAIPEGGACFFADDGGIVRGLYGRTHKEKWLTSLNDRGADVWCEDVETGPFGSRFTLCTKGGSVACETRLLGEHAIANILLASAVALKMHLTLPQIARGISQIQPVAHRLQLTRRPGNLTVIDDAFNSNPHGASAALKVLRAFPGRRIIITPGMVELGEEEKAFNRAFGEEMAQSTDIAILVGPKHTQPIREGLLSQSFAEENVHTVRDLNEAAALLKTLARPGDTVLFENDLPDNYAE